jgi:uncharacterized iron-regulated protein
MPASHPPIPTDPPPLRESTDYQVYRSDGTPSSLADLTASMANADVVLMGEEHDDAVGHRFQLAVLEQAVGRYLDATPSRPVVLSMEMFERDVQYVVDEYLGELITEDHFLRSSRPWDTYQEFYRPMVELAKRRGLRLVAANSPRRYVNRASRLGRESLMALPDVAKVTLPPLPYPEPTQAYLDEWNGLMGEAAGHMAGSPLDGQTLWDAGMAYSIAEALEATEDALVIHLAGGFHVENHTGISEVLQHYRPGTRDVVVAVRAVADPSMFDAEEHAGRGDFVVLTVSGGA